MSGPLTWDQRNLVCHWDTVTESFDRVAARFRATDIEWLVLLYPSWPAGDEWSNYGQAGFELHEKLTEHLDALGAEVLDLLPLFEQVNPADYRVEPSDPWHPNAKGHELIADAVVGPLADLVRSSERFRRASSK